MSKTAHSNYVLRPQSAFDSFLFAAVGDDDRGTEVSVLSALTRLDIDPWQRASELAQLPREASERELSAIIAGLGGVPAAQLHPQSIAARLITLLPSATKAHDLGRKAPFASSEHGKPASSRFMITWVVAVAVALAAQSIISASQQPSQPPSSTSSVAAPDANPLPRTSAQPHG